MVNNNRENRQKGGYYNITCKQCGGSWKSQSGKPLECGLCRSVNWDKDELVERGATHTPFPKVDHSIPLPLKAGMHCPYEMKPKSHTVMMDSHSKPLRFYCSSCDYVWDLLGQPLGEDAGIGARL